MDIASTNNPTTTDITLYRHAEERERRGHLSAEGRAEGVQADWVLVSSGEFWWGLVSSGGFW